ncbi:MAG: nucleotide sugar dehydrogenase, partial [Mycobacteriaceae bacterium]
DVNPATVELVNRGVEPFPGEAHLQEKLTEVVSAGVLTARTDTAAAVAVSQVVVVVVPLFVGADDAPDFAVMDSATTDIGRGLQPGTLVLFETTLPVGTTRRRWAPLLERTSGLVAGSDFEVAFSPERVLTGRVFADLRRYPKLIGALSAEGARRAGEFYSAVLTFDERPDLPRVNGVWDLGSAEAAELAKLAETTYRDVNIGLANQFAVYADAHGIDVHQVIEACNSQPYSHLHSPGIAVGGHCIPVYPRLYLAGDPSATIVAAARKANAAMPAHAVSLAASAYGELSGARAVVLGAAYRGGVKETAFSGVFATVEALRERGATVTVHDPLYDDDELAALGLVPHTLGSEVDVAVLQADHAGYTELTEAQLPGVRVIVDGRRMLNASSFPGATLVVLGRGGQA